MKQFRKWLVSLSFSAVPTMIAVSAHADGPKPSHHAKVAIEVARATALALVPGVVRDEELENEGGRWIYSFEIKPATGGEGIIKEVNVDADTGRVVGDVETEKDGR